MPGPYGNPFAQVIDYFGNPVPVLKPVYTGAGVAPIDHAFPSGSSSAEAAVHDGTAVRMVRITAIGAACYAVFQAAGGAAAGAGNGMYLGADDWRDIPLLKGETHVRAYGIGAAGTLRIERLV